VVDGLRALGQRAPRDDPNANAVTVAVRPGPLLGAGLPARAEDHGAVRQVRQAVRMQWRFAMVAAACSLLVWSAITLIVVVAIFTLAGP